MGGGRWASSGGKQALPSPSAEEERGWRRHRPPALGRVKAWDHGGQPPTDGSTGTAGLPWLTGKAATASDNDEGQPSHPAATAALAVPKGDLLYLTESSLLHGPFVSTTTSFTETVENISIFNMGAYSTIAGSQSFG